MTPQEEECARAEAARTDRRRTAAEELRRKPPLGHPAGKLELNSHL
jgi:membrane protein involved in colicin uptake